MDDFQKAIRENQLKQKLHIYSNIELSNEDVNEDIKKALEIDIEKSRVGVYEDTSENRKLGRVGMKYGSAHTEEDNKK